ncbi:fungal-specific transcription factor domain-containing protein [Amylostereum chailletii]|nr:fungal-specific transcription factor domain-containing protein [Amylostereum chailletii]
MADDSASPVEYKKDGTVSRMRAHKGNVPQLPQTKLCPFCPAKFTRTTHLNRHLRNHTNERLYRCEACSAQFTRSDLLARHRKSCTDSANSNIGRARRRSCQPCAALKVKCDLRQPCSKCKARSRECMYPPENPDDLPPVEAANPPEPVAGPSRRIPPVGVPNVDGSAGFDPGSLARPNHAQTSAFPELSLIEETSSAFAPPLSEANLDAFLGMQAQGGRGRPGAMSLPTVNDVESTVNTMPSFHQFDARAFTSFVPSDIAAPTNPAGLGSFNFEPFFRGIFTNPSGESSSNAAHPLPNDIATPFVAAPDPMSMDQQMFESMFNPNPANGLAETADGQTFMGDLDHQLLMDMIATTYPSIMEEPEPDEPYVSAHQEVMNIFPGSQNATYTQAELDALLQPLPEPAAQAAAPAAKKVPNPTTEELQHYLHIFLTAFSPQIPIIHTPTLRVEYKPAMLVRAMQACGALFVKTEVAEAFVEETLATSREALVTEFAKPVANPKHQLLIIMTLILLQTIGLFHQSPQQRAASNIYHGMLVLMVRQNRVMERSLSWKMPSFPSPDPDALDAAWRDWAVHEAIKRTILLVYCHDHSHRIFFGLPTSFTPEEMVLALPCEEALWTAKSPFAWSQLLLAESAYGGIPRRILGVPMLHGMAALGLEGGAMDSAEPLKDVGIVSPFGHFVLMHALIGELVRRCASSESPLVKAKRREEAGHPPEQEEEVDEHVFAMQLA